MKFLQTEERKKWEYAFYAEDIESPGELSRVLERGFLSPLEYEVYRKFPFADVVEHGENGIHLPL